MHNAAGVQGRYQAKALLGSAEPAIRWKVRSGVFGEADAPEGSVQP